MEIVYVIAIILSAAYLFKIYKDNGGNLML